MPNKYLTEVKNPNSLSSLLMIIVGVGLFLYSTFTPSFISGHSSYWLAENEDITQYISGFNAYFSSPWHWPLLYFDNFNYPEGTRATFVDIIPIYSLVLKLFVPASLFPFNPFGLWVALCFFLQGVSAWWIARELKSNSWVILFFLAISFTLYPALMARLGHISLMSHWILLFSFALYLKSNTAKNIQFKSYIALLFLAFYINIYLFAMSYAIYTVTIFHLRHLNGPANQLKFIITPLVVVVFSLFATILPLPDSSISKEWGFGYYSMNILSPIIGGDIIRIQSEVMPGQYEGFNYLGLGVLTLFVWALILNYKHSLNSFKHHRALTLLALLFSFYAISNQIYWGKVHIAYLSYPNILDGITSQFRASGRFFWAVGYAMIVFSVIIVYRHTKKSIAVVFIFLLALLQIVDLGERISILKKTSNRAASSVLDHQALTNLLHKKTSTIYFYPKFRCAKNSSPHDTLLPIMKYTSENKLALNTGYIARYQPPCDDIRSEIERANFKTAAFIFAQKDFTSTEVIRGYFPHDIHPRCLPLGNLFLCIPD